MSFTYNQFFGLTLILLLISGATHTLSVRIFAMNRRAQIIIEHLCYVEQQQKNNNKATII